MKAEAKAAFARYIRERRDRLQIAAQQDLAIMADAVSRLPDNVGKLTDERARKIMDKIRECELQFLEDKGGAVDEQWKKHFYP